MHRYAMIAIASLYFLCAAAVAAPPRAIVLDGDGPWRDANWRTAAQELRQLLADAGYEVRTVAPPQLTRETATQAALIAAPSLERLPRTAIQTIVSLLGATPARAGGGFPARTGAAGRLLATGGEPFRHPLYESAKGEWVSEDDFLAAVPAQRVIFEPGDASDLDRVTNQNNNDAGAVRFGTAGPEGYNNALTVSLKNLSGDGKGPAFQGYDFICPRPFATSPFHDDENMTIVTVRGTAGQVLAVRWEEQDGSRWVAQVPLTPEWKTHALLPSDFQPVHPPMLHVEDRFWVGQPSRRLGQPFRRDDNPYAAFDPTAAHALSFGVSTGMRALPGALEYSIAPIRIAASPLTARFTPPVIETLSPWYQQHPAQRNGQQVRVPQPRPRNLAGALETQTRYQAVGPLLDPVATRVITDSGSEVIWLPSSSLEGSDRATVVELLRGDATGVALLGAGPSQVVVPPGQAVALRARVKNGSRNRQALTLTWTVRRGSETIRTQRVPLELGPRETTTVEADEASPLPPGEYRVETVLALADTPCDRIESPLRVFDPLASRDSSKRVRVVDGHFSVGGKRVYLAGSNYSLNLRPEAYDPELIETDLTTMEKLGFNTISVSYGMGSDAAPFLDFLDRCRRHGLWAHISIRAASYVFTPGATFDPGGIRRTLISAHLPGNDRVFAYDIVWEPHFGGYQERRSRDSLWRQWIADQYGTVEAAEQAWGILAPKDAEGLVTNPPDRYFRVDGAHRALIAAYRRFQDDYISREYGKVARVIRTIDPDALLGVRTGWGGTMTINNNRSFGFDLASGAGHLDFIGPEGYGQPPDTEAGRKWGILAAYARQVSGGKPVVWPEFGGTVGLRDGTAEERRRQNALMEGMMRVNAEADCDGAIAWWWIGWRVDESMDFGLMDSDRTPRPSAHTLSDWGKKLNAGPLAGRGEPVVVRIDRDADARASFGIRENVTEEYLKAREAGRPVVFATAGTGTDTANMPLVQVGNVPYRGRGPLKFANAEIAGIRVTWQGGEALVENGAEVRVPAGQNVQMQVGLFNSGEAAWAGARTPQRPGDCFFRTDNGDRLAIPERVGMFGKSTAGPISRQVGQTAVEVTGRMEALERGPFGEVLRVRLVPEHSKGVINR
jgi:hypothetical protein